jgi:hypothetical protein
LKTPDVLGEAILGSSAMEDLVSTVSPLANRLSMDMSMGLRAGREAETEGRAARGEGPGSMERDRAARSPDLTYGMRKEI